MNPFAFTTSHGTDIPGFVMERVCSRLIKGHDWQLIATEDLRRFIPPHADELDDVDEILREADHRNEGPQT